MENKSFIVLMAIILITAVMPMTTLYGQNTSEIIGDSLNSDIAWRIENNTLYISGQGVIQRKTMTNLPWYKYRQIFQSVVIEEGITGVGQSIFAGQRNITSLTIAESVKELAPNSFMSGVYPPLVEVKSAIPPNISYMTFPGSNLKRAKLIVPAGTKATYDAEPNWNKFGTIEESAQPANTQPDYAETLDEPCAIYLHRISQLSGAGAKMRVFLNGVEQEKISNGKTNLIQTDRVKNELYLLWGKTVLAICRFDAIAGAYFLIEYSNTDRYLENWGYATPSDLIAVKSISNVGERGFLSKLMDDITTENLRAANEMDILNLKTTDSKSFTIEELTFTIEELRKAIKMKGNINETNK